MWEPPITKNTETTEKTERHRDGRRASARRTASVFWESQRTRRTQSKRRRGGPCVRKGARPARGPVGAWRASHATLWGRALTRPRPGTTCSGDAGDAGDSGDTGARLTPLCTTADAATTQHGSAGDSGDAGWRLAPLCTTACRSRAWRAFCSPFSVFRSPGRLCRPICICAGDMVSYARFRPLAQLVEHGTFNAGVAGPSPARPTIYQAPQASA